MIFNIVFLLKYNKSIVIVMHCCWILLNLPDIFNFFNERCNLFYKNGLLECLFNGDADPTYINRHFL